MNTLQIPQTKQQALKSLSPKYHQHFINSEYYIALALSNTNDYTLTIGNVLANSYFNQDNQAATNIFPSTGEKYIEVERKKISKAFAKTLTKSIDKRKALADIIYNIDDYTLNANLPEFKTVEIQLLPISGEIIIMAETHKSHEIVKLLLNLKHEN